MFQRITLFAPVLLLVAVIIGAAVAVVWAFLVHVLMPPDRIVMAAGTEGGGYHAFAKRYQAILAWDDIQVELRETSGAVENARLLEDGEVDIAFLQGGIPISNDAPLEALAAVFLEPVLIFQRIGNGEGGDMADWSGLRVAAGADGSGTRTAVDNIIRRLDLSEVVGELVPLGGQDATDALRSGQVDAAVFVAPIDAPYLVELLNDPRFMIHPMRDGAALARQLPYVRLVDIPRSGLDYLNEIPRERIELTAMVATLAAQETLHPALVNRLVRAAQRIHGGPSILTPEPEFPSAKGTTLPVDGQASAALERPAGTFEAILPYWMAAQITRLTVVVVPLIVLLLPILRATPGLLAWRIRSRVFRHYGQLVKIEEEAASGPMTDSRRDEILKKLESIDAAITRLNVPPRYREYTYALRVHVDLVERRLREDGYSGETA